MSTSIPQSTCTKCGETKPLSAFSPEPRNRSGVRSQCKVCRTAHQKAKYHVNPEVQKERNHKNYEATKERVVELLANYTKNCSKCGKIKPASGFSPQKTTADGLKSWCKDCNSALARKGYANNPDRAKEYTRKWRSEHADYERQKMREYNAQYYQENGDHVRRRVKAYTESNPEKVETFRKAYRATPAAQALKKAAHQRRRALKLGNGGNHTAAQWIAMCDWFGNICLKCGKAEITVDHVVPITKGGSNDITNLQPLCGECNMSKGNRSSADYRDVDQLAAFLDTL